MEVVKVRKNETKKYCGKVYDLNVEGEHTYQINKYSVHNSGAGSLTLFCLGITKIDPIRFDLLFERFISSTRSPSVVYDYFVEDEE